MAYGDTPDQEDSLYTLMNMPENGGPIVCRMIFEKKNVSIEDKVQIVGFLKAGKITDSEAFLLAEVHSRP